MAKAREPSGAGAALPDPQICRRCDLKEVCQPAEIAEAATPCGLDASLVSPAAQSPKTAEDRAEAVPVPS